VLAGYAGRIQHDNEHSRDGTRDESWEDPVTGSGRQVAYDAQGQIESVFGTITRGRTQRTVWVLYPARNWTSDEHRVPFEVPHVRNSAARIAQTYRDKVANGKAKILGRTLIGGRQTLHLHETIHFPPPTPPNGVPLPKGFRLPPTPDFQVDSWVDPVTYLPVRTTSFAENRGAASVTDESWLLRTKANIAKTKVVIPAGFKRLIPNQGSFDSQIFTATSTRCA
jgi:hypothetical protein